MLRHSIQGQRHAAFDITLHLSPMSFQDLFFYKNTFVCKKMEYLDLLVVIKQLRITGIPIQFNSITGSARVKALTSNYIQFGNIIGGNKIVG